MSTYTGYDNPLFGLRVTHLQGLMSMSAAGTALVGSTLKCFTKFEVLGATVVFQSGASVGTGTPKTLNIGRVLAAGTASVHQKFTCTASAAGSALNDSWDFSLSTPMTVLSIGECAVINGSSATIADHGCVLKDVVWRWRIIPDASY